MDNSRTKMSPMCGGKKFLIKSFSSVSKIQIYFLSEFASELESKKLKDIDRYASQPTTNQTSIPEYDIERIKEDNKAN